MLVFVEFSHNLFIIFQAASAAAVDALHLLQVCRVCKNDKVGVKQAVQPQPSAQPSAQPQFSGQPQLSGQPQQFFDQFRQGQFTLPPRLPMPPGMKVPFDQSLC